MLIVAVCTAALVVVLSVFNGLENLLRTLYTTFDPQIKVEAAVGKSFNYTPELASQLSETEGVAIITEVIEDYAYVRYRGADIVITLKGLSDNFLDQKRIDDAIVAGDLRFHEGSVDYAIVGRGIQYALGISTNSDIYPLQVHYIKDVKTSTLDPNRLYSKKNILVGSVFAIEKNYDENYIFVPLDFARDLLDYEDKRTSLEIKVDPSFDVADVKSSLIDLLGDDFQVLDNEEQHRDLYKLLNLEKVFVFIAFAFILGVGSINIFFALTMLALDKKKDIAVLYAMGANDRLIRRIFLSEGVIISLGGAFLGMALGAVICWLQQSYGLVSMGMESSILTSYPVKMQLSDFLYTSAALILITFIISYRPAVIATRFQRVENL